MSECQNEMMEAGGAYPRSCPTCGLGPCARRAELAKPREPMKVLGLLENQWFKDPARMKRILEAHYKGDRSEFIRTFLFWSCKTGKMLTRAFGEPWCQRITWEETSTQMGSRPGEKFPPDLAHVVGAVERHRPHVIIAFGATAMGAINRATSLPPEVAVLIAPHPAARHDGVADELWAVRQKLDAMDLAWRRGAKIGVNPNSAAQGRLF